MAWETTEYFREKWNHPRVTLEHAIEAAEHAAEVQLQANGRLRVWGYVEELDKYVRVVLLPDKRTIHNRSSTAIIRAGINHEDALLP